MSLSSSSSSLLSSVRSSVRLCIKNEHQQKWICAHQKISTIRMKYFIFILIVRNNFVSSDLERNCVRVCASVCKCFGICHRFSLSNYDFFYELSSFSGIFFAYKIVSLFCRFYHRFVLSHIDISHIHTLCSFWMWFFSSSSSSSFHTFQALL